MVLNLHKCEHISTLHYLCYTHLTLYSTILVSFLESHIHIKTYNSNHRDEFIFEFTLIDIYLLVPIMLFEFLFPTIVV